jgi:hypothetical protein
MSKVATWIEKKAIPWIEKRWKPIALIIGFILVVIIGKVILGGLANLFGGKAAPPADKIVATADAEKAKIEQAVPAATDQGVADAYNAAEKKAGP